ncbi:alpha/beta fold hydrolase [Clostridium felsineum]|uniref:alpha/beta fold hydrolase n=1 Tax=Clostridium felsineum TaxID=36839 RepID=UPI00098C1823|nr:alpha/beta hydrolase [Clostridium felsineum]URZ16104.1 2-hydroxy-6-oxononadienedioate/2-hydroxy-6-oxononatrienedioate hydrolase [Clostridium felsineum DSM 794]
METKKLENKHRSIAYYIDGTKCSHKILLFLNGLYVGNTSWIKQKRYKYFRDNYKIIFMDYPGVGESIEKTADNYGMDDVVDIIRNILDMERDGFEECNLIGYSVGGMISLRFMYRFPDCIQKLVLLNTGADVDEVIANKIYDITKRLLTCEESLESIFKSVYPLHHSSEYLEKVKDMENKIIEAYVKYNKDRIALGKFLKSIRNRPNLRESFKKIKIPTLIIGADEDKIFDHKYQDELVDNIEITEYHNIKACGHSSYIEKYREINKLMENFFRKQY